MNISLYQAAADKQREIELCTDDDGVIDTDKLALIEGTFANKAVATVAVYKGIGHRLEMLCAYKSEIEKRIAHEVRNQDRLKDYLHAAMLVAGVDKIKSDDGLLTATLYRDRDESVEIDEGAIFPPELCNEPKPPTVSKTKVRAAILAGQAVAGARIVRRDRMEIK